MERIDEIEPELIDEVRSCSSPFERGDHALMQELIVVHAQEYTRVLLERFQARLLAQTDGLVPWIGQGVSAPMAFDVAWDPAFGHVRRSVLYSAVDPVVAAVQLGLHLHAQGFVGQWSAHLEKPSDLKWGRLLLPLSSVVHIDGSVLSATDAAGRTLILKSHNGGLPACAPAFESLSIGSWPLHITPQDCASTIMADYGIDWTREPLARVTSTCREAIDLLESFAPPYRDWVGRLLRYVVPVDGRDGLMKSKSSHDWPSVAEASFPAKAVSLAEMLVHEASHQYVHVASRLGELWDQTDARRYYSPVKGTDRPIFGIFLAFHAFANVVLFYRCCIERDLASDGYCERNERRHLSELEILLDHLQSDNGLTSIADALWKPLAQRVFS